MPKITLYRKPSLIYSADITRLAQQIRSLVALKMSDHAAGQPLTIEQVEVRIVDAHPLDINTGDLEIEISSAATPGRAATAKALLDEIAGIVQAVIPKVGQDPPRNPDVWIEIDLGNRQGRAGWTR